MMLGIDPIYFLFVGPAMLLAMWAQWRVHSAYSQASEIPAESGMTGAQAAHEVMRAAGVQGVEIEPVEGFLSDHYDPSHKVLRLSPGVYGSWPRSASPRTRRGIPSRMLAIIRSWSCGMPWCRWRASAATFRGSSS
jgi:hypothetical protein